jgi:ribose transport system permease protein
LVRLRGKDSQSAWQRNVVLAAAVIAITAAFGLRIPAFLSAQTLFDMWQQAALLMVVSIGATFVIIAGELDLSIGAVVGLMSVVVPSLLAAGSPMPIAVLVALVIGAAVGFANAAITLRLQVPSFIATLGTMAIVSGLAVTVSLTPLTVTSSSFAAVFTNRIHGVPLTGIYALAAVAVTAWFLPASRFGLHVRAVGSGEMSAVLQGISARRVKYLVFVTAGVLSAAGGVLLLGASLTGYSDTGKGLELSAIAAVLLGGGRLGGGRGDIVGTFLGALVLTVALYGIAGLGWLQAWQDFTMGISFWSFLRCGESCCPSLARLSANAFLPVTECDRGHNGIRDSCSEPTTSAPSFRAGRRGVAVSGYSGRRILGARSVVHERWDPERGPRSH